LEVLAIDRLNIPKIVMPGLSRHPALPHGRIPGQARDDSKGIAKRFLIEKPGEIAQ
jgi:hypothetical protein